jgi:hypothetical protein
MAEVAPDAVKAHFQTQPCLGADHEEIYGVGQPDFYVSASASGQSRQDEVRYTPAEKARAQQYAHFEDRKFLDESEAAANKQRGRKILRQ